MTRDEFMLARCRHLEQQLKNPDIAPFVKDVISSTLARTQYFYPRDVIADYEIYDQKQKEDQMMNGGMPRWLRE